MYLKDSTTVSARLLIPKILPRQDDYINLKDVMVMIVMQILVDHLPVLENIKKHIPKRKHRYSAEMNMKSDVVN